MVTGWQLLVIICSGLLFFCKWIVQWWTVWRWLVHSQLGPSQLCSLSRKFKVSSVQCAVLHCFFLLPSCLVLICVRLPWLETQGLKPVARNVNVSELKNSIARTGVKHVRTRRHEAFQNFCLDRSVNFVQVKFVLDSTVKGTTCGRWWLMGRKILFPYKRKLGSRGFVSLYADIFVFTFLTQFTVNNTH